MNDPNASSLVSARRTITQGYNATVLAYGQTGSGKAHTMSGGVGIHGIKDRRAPWPSTCASAHSRPHVMVRTSAWACTHAAIATGVRRRPRPQARRVPVSNVAAAGVTPRVIRHMFALVDALNKKAKPGERVEVGTGHAHMRACMHAWACERDRRPGRGVDAGVALYAHAHTHEQAM